MRWITRQNIKVDRVACPWLITRFVDAEAEFLFVPEAELLATAEREHATPFDATRLPEVTLNLFGLLANSSLDLPVGSMLTQDSIKQLKLGADLTLQALNSLAIMLRYDTLNYDLDHPAYVFAAITGRVAVSTHYLSGERVYLQYSRYIYGDNMVLAAQWPWGAPLVAGSNVLQQGPYFGKTPDENIVRAQADISF